MRDLRAFSTPSTLQVVYRSNVPALITCNDTMPRPRGQGVELGAKFENYAVFPSFDRAWHDHPHGDVNVLDVWDLVGQRPDARRDPSKRDCLHVCMPISKTWSAMLWTWMSAPTSPFSASS